VGDNFSVFLCQVEVPVNQAQREEKKIYCKQLTHRSALIGPGFKNLKNRLGEYGITILEEKKGGRGVIPFWNDTSGVNFGKGEGNSSLLYRNNKTSSC